MSKRLCKRETCGMEFEPRRSNQLYCDTWCQMMHNQRLYKQKDIVRLKRRERDRVKRERAA